MSSSKKLSGSPTNQIKDKENLISDIMKYSIGYNQQCYMVLYDQNRESSVLYTSIRHQHPAIQIRKLLKQSQDIKYYTNDDFEYSSTKNRPNTEDILDSDQEHTFGVDSLENEDKSELKKQKIEIENQIEVLSHNQQESLQMIKHIKS